MINYNLTSLVPIYQNGIDSIINQLGKRILLVFEPQILENPTSETYDKIRNSVSKKPSFKQENPATEEPTEIITGLTMWNPKESVIRRDLGMTGTTELHLGLDKTIVRLKTYMTDVPALRRCKYIVPNYDSEGIFSTKFTLLRGPLPKGLGEDRYSVSYWIQS